MRFHLCLPPSTFPCHHSPLPCHLALLYPHTHFKLTCAPQHDFELETINIQAPGQESWKRKYVYWIPALHIDGKEVAKGRWDAQTVTEALERWRQEQAAAKTNTDADSKST